MTDRAGLGGDRDWPTSAAFADLDGDGDLDLYVCHYMKWDERETRTCADPNDPTVYRCLPLDFEALPDHLFRNDGGRFVDVTAEAGIVDRDGRGLGVVAADLDEDGRVDLFVANDMTANLFFRNLGGMRFEESGLAAGLAGNATGAYQAGMGVACGDLDGDGRLDLAVTNFYNESTTFFRNFGQGFFGDQTAAIGLAGPSRYVLGFGIAFLDADNDGWLDLITANGHVHDGRPQFPWKMPVQLFLNDGRGRVMDVTRQSGPAVPGPPDGTRAGRRRPRSRRPHRRRDRLAERAGRPVPQPDRRPAISSPSASREPPRTATPSAPSSPSTATAGPGSLIASAGAAISPPATLGSISAWARRGGSTASRSDGPRAAWTNTQTSPPIRVTCSAREIPHPGRSWLARTERDVSRSP